MENTLPIELKHLVREIFDLWGQVIREEAGSQCYAQIEDVRKYIKTFRTRQDLTQEILAIKHLEATFQQFSTSDLEDVTHAFSALLELINLCENAFRSARLRRTQKTSSSMPSDQEIYLVLTAHPTESRSPDVVQVLQKIQSLLLQSLLENEPEKIKAIRPWLKQLWFLRLARQTKPEVKDEADYIYSLIFRDEIIDTLLEAKYDKVYIRTWVGGDKDGHPGVDENTMQESLQLSRGYLLTLLEKKSNDVLVQLHRLTQLQRKGSRQIGEKARARLAVLIHDLSGLRKIGKDDGKKVQELSKQYTKWLGNLNPTLRETLVGWKTLELIWKKFPALVVPLELRESSEFFSEDIRTSKTHRKTHQKNAILRMLLRLARISGPLDPRNYARGLIISMASSLNDLENARKYAEFAFGKKQIFPIIPLFEQASALIEGPTIVDQWLQQTKLKSMEVMLGYSDSSKESGVLPSRFLIANALVEFEKIVQKNPGLRMTYFHGSGGSVARGGGPLELQTAHWPKTAFDRFKVTLQGEMIQRTFSTPEILSQYLDKIQSLSQTPKPPYRLATNASAVRWIQKISEIYKSTLALPEFIQMVEHASAYKYLEFMQFGSRPTKRKKLVGVSSLRAIPWVLAWTQTRSLLPTWWGVGSAFANLSPDDVSQLQKLFQNRDPVLTTYLQLLGYTLTKIEPEIWFLYLERSRLPQDQKKSFYKEFLAELQKTTHALQTLTGQDELLWFKPWLAESIRLRSPLIHPLNVAQVLAWDDKNHALLRESAVGIACGMLTTG